MVGGNPGEAQPPNDCERSIWPGPDAFDVAPPREQEVFAPSAAVYRPDHGAAVVLIGSPDRPARPVDPSSSFRDENASPVASRGECHAPQLGGLRVGGG